MDLESLEDTEFINKIDFGEIVQEQLVGEGSFGKVYKAQWNGLEVAVKNVTTKEELKAFYKELKQLSRVQHENIIKLFGACTKGPYICLILEYADGGSLFNVLHNLRRKVHYNIGHALSWAYQCAKGVEYLHAMRPTPVIHRDLKSPNLLLTGGGALLKICDFGTAVDKRTNMTNNIGSAPWMAPEVFRCSAYTEKCDNYSWSIILWEVMSRRQPFSEFTSTYQIMWAVSQGRRPNLLENCPPVLDDILVRCWESEPAKRPNMNEIVELMKQMVALFPEADEPLMWCESEDEEEEEEGEEYDYKSDERSTEDFGADVVSSNRTIILPQPPKSFETPLQIDTDPNAWELENDNMKLEPRAGFDRMVPKNCSTNKVQAGVQSFHSEPSKEDDFENIHMLLDDELRPATPDLTNPKSVALFEEHKKLAQEFLKVQTEIVMETQKAERLRATQSEAKQKQAVRNEHLQSEKDSLVLLRESLLKQKQTIVRVSGTQSITPMDEWVIFSRNEDS